MLGEGGDVVAIGHRARAVPETEGRKSNRILRILLCGNLHKKTYWYQVPGTLLATRYLVIWYQV